MTSSPRRKRVDIPPPAPPKIEKPIRTCFKRLETDKEYAARLRACGYDVSQFDGASWLDRVGDAANMQRKIVEDVA